MKLAVKDELSKREARAHRLQLRKDLAAELRKRDSERLRDLKEKVRAAKKKLRAQLRGARELCHSERSALREKLRERRRAALEALREAFEAERQAAREVCARRKLEVQAEALTDIQRAERILEEERQLRRELARAEAQFQKKSRARSTAKERRQESDDEVRGNLPPELVPVFDRVRRRIKATPRKSRTEAFLEWAEENAAEVVAMQSDDAARDVERLIREHEKQQRKMKKAGRYQRSPEELAAELAAVPF